MSERHIHEARDSDRLSRQEQRAIRAEIKTLKDWKHRKVRHSEARHELKALREKMQIQQANGEPVSAEDLKEEARLDFTWAEIERRQYGKSHTPLLIMVGLMGASVIALSIGLIRLSRENNQRLQEQLAYAPERKAVLENVHFFEAARERDGEMQSGHIGVLFEALSRDGVSFIWTTTDMKLSRGREALENIDGKRIGTFTKGFIGAYTSLPFNEGLSLVVGSNTQEDVIKALGGKSALGFTNLENYLLTKQREIEARARQQATAAAEEDNSSITSPPTPVVQKSAGR